MSDEFLRRIDEAGRSPLPEDIVHTNSTQSWRHRGDILTRMECPDCGKLIAKVLWRWFAPHLQNLVEEEIRKHVNAKH